jgi:DNA repair protein RecN (Recombination protein N)
MLLELVVQNLVIVQRARLEPAEGLTVISGETGAGKSLLLDALVLLLGGRAGSKLVGPGGADASVTGVFQVSAELAASIESATGVAPQDGTYILRRRMATSGRSQAWMNDLPVTVGALQEAAQFLVEIRAQHEAQRLGEVTRQLQVLDAFAGLESLAERYRIAHGRCNDLQRQLDGIEHGERGSLKELDFLRYQSREIAGLDPKPGELADLERRHEALAGAEEWRRRAADALDGLSEGDRAVGRVLGTLVKRLSDAPDDRLQAAARACGVAIESVNEAAAHCRDVLEYLHGDPAELKRIEERRDSWYDLLRKHGEDEAHLIAAWRAIDERIAAIEGLDETRERLRAELASARAERQELGAELAESRQRGFSRLAKKLLAELSELGMPKAKIELSSTPMEVPGPYGIVQQEILVAVNPGMPSDRLGAVLSGGEAARLSLAFAIVLAAQDHTPVLVFDEVDSGVGGRLGAVIGAKLAALAQGRSVIVITHTPQVAAAASRHYVVRKHHAEDRTEVEVDELTGEDRLRELADMLGGGKAALGQAKSLMGKDA